MEYLKVKDLPETERPYEKCVKYGAEVLTDSELIAVIIRSGSRNERSTELAYRILTLLDGRKGLSVLNHVTYKQLLSVKGIGRVKAVQLLCVAELSKRISRTVGREKISFDNPEMVAGYFMESMRHLEREQVRVVFLDIKLHLIAEKVLYEGTVGMAPMESREIFREGLKYDAVYFILLHNHPSGDPEPSITDISTTKRIRDGGHLIGLRLQDHIIIGDNRYVSMKQSGLI